MNIKISRISGVMLCVAAMLLCMLSSFAVPVYADDCTLTLICKKQDEPISNVKWNIYRVGEKSKTGEYSLTGQFADYPVSLDGIETVSQAQEAAGSLENYAVLDKLAPDASGVSDSEGAASLGTVTAGVYLICGETYLTDEFKVTPSPMLLELTSEDLAEGNITAYAKFEYETITNETEFGVRKVWDMQGSSDSLRPESIKVGIYCDNELTETVELNEENNWEYFWKGSAKSDWRVKEIDVPEDFTVVVKTNETLFQIENTYVSKIEDSSSQPDSSSSSSVPDSSSSSSVPDSSSLSSKPDSSTASSKPSSGNATGTGNEKLPQTGSLWWPVPVLAGVGVVLIAAGGRLNKKRK